ncbi:hypothetical protein JCM12214_27960 [Geobacillus vulcani]
MGSPLLSVIPYARWAADMGRERAEAPWHVSQDRHTAAFFSQKIHQSVVKWMAEVVGNDALA